MSPNPEVVLLFSGKRKSGKDYVTNLLIDRLGSENAVIIRISGPIKSYWAESNNLDLKDLLSASAYKEQHRKEMIKWSEEVRAKDHGVFCRSAVEMFKANSKPIWIVSDVRRKTDINWFKENYDQVKTVRVEASEPVRRNRGWMFVEGIDDVSSECDLDDYGPWDFIITNDDEGDLEKSLASIISHITGAESGDKM